ncbi:MAG: hypothetical protein Q8L12_06935 [Methylibium sp.]|nr:hypothetical protein [Methylibium sp.]
MSAEPRIYRRSIWCHDANYDFAPESWSPDDMAAISRLASVEAAKKRIQPIPINSLLAISRSAKQMPAASDATEEELVDFLTEGKAHQGAGVVTLICMLSVETNGDYAPIDRKVAAGLLAQGNISEGERTSLLSSDVWGFSKAYLKRVIPAWHESRINRLPFEADNFWGGGGHE